MAHWGQPKPSGAQFRGAKWTFQCRSQCRPPRGPSAQPRTPGARSRPRATPECHLAPYNSVSGPSMVIFWRTGVHQKTHILVTFSPLGVPRSGPGGGGGGTTAPWATQAQPGQNGPGEPFRHAKWSIPSRAQGGPLKAPSVRPGQPAARRRPRTTPASHLTPHNSVS